MRKYLIILILPITLFSSQINTFSQDIQNLDLREDEKGPDNPDWEMYLGNYGVFIGGNPVARAQIEKKNGYLYVSYMNQSDRLEEIEPGIFMSARGEILQFGKEITFASLFELVRTVQE